MSNNTHRSWWATKTGVRNSDGYIVYTNSVSRYEGQDERYKFEVHQRESDKQLIAAAPELLEALKDCRQALVVGGFTGELLVVDAAIKKATGATK